jgi:hypothetical protein
MRNNKWDRKINKILNVRTKFYVGAGISPDFAGAGDAFILLRKLIKETDIRVKNVIMSQIMVLYESY